jgi:hypothetical protein
MRHGRKSSQTRFDGYKLSAAATNTEVPLITAVDVAPASEPDGPRAKHLVDAQSEARRPKRLLGDTAYGTASARETSSLPWSFARSRNQLPRCSAVRVEERHPWSPFLAHADPSGGDSMVES